MPISFPINVSPAPATDTSFSPIPSDTVIGPVPVAPTESTTLNPVTAPTQTPQTINVWSVMTKFDDGLRKALINFINTNKDGNLLPPTSGGRTKKMDFFFQGTPSVDLSPGEMGSFSVVFSYPPGANSTSVNTTATAVPAATTNTATSLG